MVDQVQKSYKRSLLWVYWLPLLFLPNLGLQRSTPFGTLTLADFLIAPYLVLVFWSTRHSVRIRKLYVGGLLVLMIAFLWWATISTLFIPVQYDYRDNARMLTGLLKLAKMALYVVAILLTIRALSNGERERHAFQWSVVAAGVVVGGVLLLSQNSYDSFLSFTTEVGTGQVYQDNPVSAMLAILITFITGLLVNGSGSRRWRLVASLGLVIMVLGFVLDQGRGGWVAAIIGAFYLFSRIDFRRTLLVTVLASALVFFAYNNFPRFQEQIDRTFQPDEEELARYNAGVAGFDDGARLFILVNEAPRVLESPILGRGIFNRGGLSGISGVGSHNFFLQMFLETGIPGGLLILAIFWNLWRHAGSAYDGALKLPVRSALLTAFVAGFSGEYFYGGMMLFTLFLVYALVGSAPIRSVEVTKPSLAASKPSEPARLARELDLPIRSPQIPLQDDV